MSLVDIRRRKIARKVWEASAYHVGNWFSYGSMTYRIVKFRTIIGTVLYWKQYKNGPARNDIAVVIGNWYSIEGRPVSTIMINSVVETIVEGVNPIHEIAGPTSRPPTDSPGDGQSGPPA